MLSIGSRLRDLRKKLNYNQTDFAAILGTGRSNLSRMEKGEYPPGQAQILLLKEKLNINPDWILNGKEPIHLEKPTPALNSLIPILASIPAGPWETWIDDYVVGAGEDYISAPSNVQGSNLFAVRVKGDSMTPTLFDGDILIINPNKQFQKGVAVVRHHWDYKIRNVRRLGGTKLFLWPQNPLYNEEEITLDNDTRLYVPVKVISMRDI